MAMKRLHENGRRWRSLLMVLAVTCSCVVAYLCFSPLVQLSLGASSSSSQALHTYTAPTEEDNEGGVGGGTGCCRGLEHTEFWSDAVNWGNDFLVDSTQECCDACKSNRKCNSWVYCANAAKCGTFHRQCWLKRQKDPLNPDIHDTAQSNPWTSGLIFEKDDVWKFFPSFAHDARGNMSMAEFKTYSWMLRLEGIVGLVIDSGTMKDQVIRIKLLSDCSPQSVLHILELAKLTHCQGCRFYRAEGRGNMWDTHGSHISKMSMGPPYAVVQGTLETQHVSFKRISKEYTPVIRRGMVGWVGGGPDFFISLVDHYEWPRKHTIFATIVEADMHLVEKLTELPTTATTWENVAIEALNTPVNLKVQRVSKQ